MELDVTTLDGTTTRVRVIFADRIAWEAYARRNDLPLSPNVTGAGGDDPQVETSTFASDTWHAFLAYKASTRSADPAPGFSEWLSDIDSIMAVPKSEPRPTEPGHSPG